MIANINNLQVFVWSISGTPLTIKEKVYRVIIRLESPMPFSSGEDMNSDAQFDTSAWQTEV